MSSAGFRLEETSQDLQVTRVKLSQEEFISSELSSVQERLYGTAGKVETRRHTDVFPVFNVHLVCTRLEVTDVWTSC